MDTHVPLAIAAVAPDGQLTLAQQRRFMVDFCRRRIRPGTGSSPEFLERRTAMNPWPDLHPILQGIPWAIVGAVATRAYMPERATKDLDILERARDSDAVRQRLEGAGYRYLSALAVPGFLLLSPERVEVTVTLGDYPWLEEELARVRSVVAQSALDEAGDLESLIYLGQVEMGKRAKEDPSQSP
jgi:hypothetical protein